MAKKLKGFAEEQQAPLSGQFPEVPPQTAGGRLKIGPGGRVVIPAEIRQALGVSEGDTLLATLVDGELRLLSVRSAVKRAQAIVREFIPPGVSLVDELIADRRREAKNDDERGR